MSKKPEYSIDDLKGTHLGGEERAVPGETDIGTVCQHVARYNAALFYANGKTVIDAACGSGYGSYILGMVAKKVHGYDKSAAAIAHANERYLTKSVSFSEQDILSISEPADLIISFETVEHIKDLSALEEVFIKNLNPGGTLMFSVPLNEAKDFNPHHEHTFTVPEAQKLFPDLTTKDELIQQGLNFYPLDSNFPQNLQYTFYLGVRGKEA